MRIAVFSNMPCISAGGFSQRILREIDLIAGIEDTELFYYTFYSYTKFRRLKTTPGLSNEKSVKKATEKVMRPYRLKGVKTCFMITSRLRRILPDGLYDKFYAHKLSTFIRKNEIDVLVCENLSCAYLGYLASKYTKVKYVFDYHGVVPEEYKFENDEKPNWMYRYLKSIEKLAVHNADHIICVSKHFKEYLIREFGVDDQRVSVVPCCVSGVIPFSRSDREQIREQMGLQDRKVIIYAGSITKYQCVREMAALFSRIIKKDSSFYFLFLSADSDYDIVYKLMEEYGIAENDYTVKSVRQKEVHKYLCMADYALIIRENHILNKVASPTKIAEYLMSGLPILGTTSAGYIEEVPAAKYMFDYEDLSRDIDKVVDDILELDRSMVDREKNCRIAAEYIREFLTWQSYKQLYSDIIYSLANTRDA